MKFLALFAGLPSIDANPIADIAVLGAPDDQELGDETEAYEALVESATPCSIADAPEQGQAWLLSLEREWFSCQASYAPWSNGPIWLTTDPENIQGGMSGSPIVSDTRCMRGESCYRFRDWLRSSKGLHFFSLNSTVYNIFELPIIAPRAAESLIMRYC